MTKDQEKTKEQLIQELDEMHQRIAALEASESERRRAVQEVREGQRVLRELLDMQERERRLVAYEIHDGLAQQVTGALYRFQAFREMLGRDSERAWETFDVGLKLLSQSVHEARGLINELRPPILDDSGLVAAIDYLVRESKGRGGQEITFHHDVRSKVLPALLERAVFRIAQETLTNARRHSQSEKVRLELVQNGDCLRMEVQDWGIGFEPAKIQKGHLGLKGICERAKLFGGHATVDSAPRKGTRVVVEIPIAERTRQGTRRP